MEWLLANYASSDDEVHGQGGSEEESEEDEGRTQAQQPEPLGSLSSARSRSSQSLHTNLDESRTTPAFGILPEPGSSSSSSSLYFSSLPPPQSSANISTGHVSGRVVQLKPRWYSTSVNRSIVDDEDDDEGDAGKAEDIVKNSSHVFQTASVESFLSSIPAPKNTSSLGGTSSGRLETVTRETTPNAPGAEKTLDANKSSRTFTQYDEDNLESHMVSGLHSDAYGPVMPKHHNHTSYASDLQSENYEGYISHNIDGDYRQSVSSFDSSVKRSGKRGSSSMVPSEIIEVSQDELMKNRPREDQMRLTGIAFGPSHEATSATTGKPSKLHKRKHQIGSLYYDMKQKEMELAERRARGLLTKAETQAKYGW